MTDRRPLTPHWTDIAALRVIKERGDKDNYVVASGITPSGTVHVGNFREVVTVAFVAKALADLGKKVHFIYSWDNFDTFRKVPKNLPDQNSFKTYLRQAIARIPDPWGKESSYAQGRIAEFEKELAMVGIQPHFIYQEKEYSSGTYAAEVRHALENRDKIRAILDRFRSEPLAEDWLPTSIYCGQCKSDHIESERYLGAWDYAYKCQNCGKEETIDIRTTGNLKLAWRIDWPMRWHHEKVDFEPGGKDHSSEGGSYDTARHIIREVWGESPPSYQQYDFVMIKGGAGKMSSSSGELYTLSQVLEVYEPILVRWIFASQRPNHDFAIAFDEDVFKNYDEFDKNEALALSNPEANDKWTLARRIYEMSCLGPVPTSLVPRPKFRVLCSRLQICGGDLERTFTKFYASEYTSENKHYFFERAQRAQYWLTHCAPQEFRYFLRNEKKIYEASSKEARVLEALRLLVTELDLEQIEEKDLNQLIWDRTIKGTSSDAKEVFRIIYLALIDREHGPRLPSFLKEIGKERLLELI